MSTEQTDSLAENELRLIARIQHMCANDNMMESILEEIGQSLGLSRCWILHVPHVSSGGDLFNDWEYWRPTKAVENFERAQQRTVPVDVDAQRAERATVAAEVKLLVDDVRRQCLSSKNDALLFQKDSIPEDETGLRQLLLKRHVAAAYLVPLVVPRRWSASACIGILIVEAPSESNLKIVTALASHLALFADNQDLHRQVSALQDRDQMTGLFSQRQFHKEVDRELNRAQFFEEQFSVVYCDIDFTKTINDSVGFPAGDATIIAVASVIQAECRQVDLVARYGGNEFIVLMPHMNKWAALKQVEHIRSKISRTQISVDYANPFHTTTSFGISSFPEDGKDWDTLWRVAQNELWFAKRAGRNRVGCQTKEGRDNLNRLHCADGPAAVLHDGYELYCWHGTFVSRDVILHPHTITVEQIETEKSIEVRRVLTERYGLSRYLEDSGADKIAEDDWGVLYSKAVLGDEPIVMVKVLNSTPEPDGQRKAYFLRVPPNLQTAHAAVAWSFGLEAHEYNPEFES